MKTRVALFDVDGIVLTGRTKYFSVRYAEERGIPVEEVSAFFTGEFKKASFGQADLKELIAPWLPKWKWEGSVDEFLEAWFSSERTKDERVLSVVAALRAAGVACYLATRNEKYRTAYLWHEAGLKDHFDGCFATFDIGVDKDDPDYFEHIFHALKLAPSEVLYFDDRQANIDTARMLGIDAHFYDGFETLESKAKAAIGG